MQRSNMKTMCRVPKCTNQHDLNSSYCTEHLNAKKAYGHPNGVARTEKIKELYREEIVILDTGCMILPDRAKDKRGYCFIQNVAGVQDYAHRVAYSVFKYDGKKLPAGLSILHSCDFPACCNLAHLRLGTALENAKDRSEHGSKNRGRRTKNTSKEMVLEIKTALMNGESGYSIAKRLKLTQSVVSDIRRGKTHANISPTGWKADVNRTPGRTKSILKADRNEPKLPSSTIRN